MIEEAYVGFEVAKLLKEKGFNEPCQYFYKFGSNELYKGTVFTNTQIGDIFYNAPTHQMAMAYLREKYDLHIIAFPYKANNEKKWCCYVYKTFNLLGCERYMNETLDSYEEAVEAALKYSLENLI